MVAVKCSHAELKPSIPRYILGTYQLKKINTLNITNLFSFKMCVTM